MAAAITFATRVYLQSYSSFGRDRKKKEYDDHSISILIPFCYCWGERLRVRGINRALGNSLNKYVIQNLC